MFKLQYQTVGGTSWASAARENLNGTGNSFATLEEAFSNGAQVFRRQYPRYNLRIVDEGVGVAWKWMWDESVSAENLPPPVSVNVRPSRRYRVLR